MHEFSQLYIGGRWVDPVGTDTIDVVDASTEEVMGHIPAGTAADVDAAVTAAKAAFDRSSCRSSSRPVCPRPRRRPSRPWSRTSPGKRRSVTPWWSASPSAS